MKTNRKVLYTIFLIALIVLAATSGFFLYYFFNMRNSNLSFNRLTIQESSCLSYNVLASDSKFYDSSVSNKAYITDEIKNIQTYFNYVLTFSGDVSVDYSYIIEGKIIGNTKGTDDHVLQKTIFKNNPEVKKYTGKVMNITDVFDINVPEYVAMKNEFIEHYGIDIDAFIEYNVIITYGYTSNDIHKSQTKKKEMKIVVPISETTTTPEIPKSEINTFYEYSELSEKDKNIYFAICLELLGAVILFTLTATLVARRLFRKNTLYAGELKKLLNNHKANIVKIKNIPDFDGIDVLFVDEFEDMLEVQKITKKPITYCEVIKGREAIFVVFNGFKAYVYKISIRKED